MSDVKTSASVKAIVRAANDELRKVGWRAVPKADLKRAADALKFPYYWHKAYKRIDIREIEGFGTFASKAIEEHRTGMKHDRLYTLWQAIARLRSAALPIAEVGAYRGGSAYFLGEALRWHGRANPFYVCDTFAGHAVVDPTVDGPHQVGEQFLNTSVDEVAEYLRPFANIRLVQGDFRETSRQLEPAAPFAFVHLDVDVYPVMKHGLDFFASRVIPGALIVVDDYGFVTCPGAKQAVDEFVSAHPDYTFLHLLTGQAVLVRVV